MAGTRLLQSKSRLAEPINVLQATPWIPTGECIASQIVKAAPGLYGGIVVQATDNGGDVDVRVWDSADADSADATDYLVDSVAVSETAANACKSHFFALEPGIECRSGIWVQVVAGDCRWVAWYK